MVNELELAVHGTSCSYNAKRDSCSHRQNARGHSGLPSLYFAYVEPDLSDHAVEKADQNGSDSPMAGSNGRQEDQAKNEDGKKQSSVRPTLGEYKPKVTLAGHTDPTYYLGGGNGNAMIEDVLNDLGWQRIRDKLDENYTMKWCELKQAINYNTFKENEQMVNHIPNCNLLTNKLGLLNTLQEYDRVYGSIKKRVPKLDFIPETYKLDDSKERELFRDKWKDGEVWICKPTGRNQGKGIFLVKSKEEVDQLIQESDERGQQQTQGKLHRPLNRIIQRYIHNPLLINNKKFDIRAYMLVASTSPYLVLYRKGYIRLSMFEYENKYENLAMHLTNQFIQKKDPKYKEVKEDTVWTMEKFNDYLNETVVPEKGIEQDWANTVLPNKMKQIMTYCFNAVKNKFHRKVGYFDLYGFDFMIDTDMKVWLIEVNVNPSLATNCEMLRQVVPAVVKETLYIVIDCFEKARKGKPVMPCQAIKDCEVLYYDSPSKSKGSSWGGSPDRQQHRSRSISPVRRPHTLSPSKELASRTTENVPQTKRGFVAVRPGMKPIPTSTYSYGSKAPGFMAVSQAGGSGNRVNASLALAKLSYSQERTPSSRSSIKGSSAGILGEKQDSKQPPKPKSEQKISLKDNDEQKGTRQRRERSKSVEKSSVVTEGVKDQNQNHRSQQRSPKTVKVETKSQAPKVVESKSEPTSSKATMKQSTYKTDGKQAAGAKYPTDTSDRNNKDALKLRKLSVIGSDKVTEESKKSINTDSSVSLKVIHAHGTASKKTNKATAAEERASRGS